MKLSKITQVMTLIAACGIPAFSATIYVNNSNKVPTCPQQQSTIQAGVDAANAGDTVFVCAGTYNEQVTISTNITLAGQTGAILMPSNMVANTTELYGNPTPLPAAVAILVQGTSSVTISDMTVDGTNNGVSSCGTDVVGIYYQNAGGTIVHNAIRYFEQGPDYFGCQVGLGVLAESNDGKSNTVSVIQNSIHDYQKDGIDIDTPSYGFLVESNTIRGVGPTGVIGQNGIEIDAAMGTMSLIGNNVSENSYICPPLPAICYAATDILNLVNGVSVTQNTVTGSNVGIYYQADDAVISSNSVSGMTNYDGIYLQDSSMDAGSTITKNTVTNSPYSIELYDSSPNVSVTNNTLIEAEYGIGNDNSTHIVNTGNKDFDVVVPVQFGVPAAGTVHKAPTPSRAR